MVINKLKKIVPYVLSVLITVLISVSVTSVSFAEVKIADLLTHEEQGDFTVTFAFEKENVDITFISPSGQKFTAADTDKVVFGEGELWATYRIINAEAGAWKVSYDLKSNSYIDFSLVEATQNITIHDFTAVVTADSKLDYSISALLGDEDVSYDFELGLIDSDGKSQIICTGNASTTEKKTDQVSLKKISSGEYTPFLNVYYDNGSIEVFDTARAAKVTYQNPDTPEAISDYRVLVNLSESIITVDWKEYISNRMDSFVTNVFVDDKLVYQNESDRNSTSADVAYPVDAKKIRIELYYYNDEVISHAAEKTIDLENGEYLKLSSGSATASSQIELQTKVEQQRYALIYVNSEVTEKELKATRADIVNCGEVIKPGDSILYLTLDKNGSNTIYAELLGGNNISYVIDTTIFYDTFPPQFKLYEDLNNKSFDSNDVSIIGEVSDCAKLVIDGDEVELSEKSTFNYNYSMKNDKNTVILEAVDANGNTSIMSLILYKKGAAPGNAEPKKSFFKENMALIIAIIVGAIMFCLFMLSLRKKNDEKKPLKVRLMLISKVSAMVVFIVSVVETIRRTLYIHSVKYLELAESDFSKAADYIDMRNTAFIIALISLLVFALIIAIPVIIRRIKAKNKSKQKS